MNQLPIDLGQLKKLSLGPVERKRPKKKTIIKKARRAAPYYKLGTYYICRVCHREFSIRSSTSGNSKLKLPKDLTCYECRGKKNANTDR